MCGVSQHDLENMFRLVDDQVAKKHWKFWHKHLATGCLHAKSCSRCGPPLSCCSAGTGSTAAFVFWW